MGKTRSYLTVTELGDFGPWISKLVIDLPGAVGVNDVSPATFNVFCARRELADGAPVFCAEHGIVTDVPSQGYVSVTAAYPCTEDGAPVARSARVALELPETPLTSTVQAGSGEEHTRCVDTCFRVTQLAELPGDPAPIAGLVFDACAGNRTPALRGWRVDRMADAGVGAQLAYAYYEPEPATAAPLPSRHGLRASRRARPARDALIVWLHGAGEGGDEISLAYEGNRVTALSQPAIQRYFGAAWVLVPQCPTFWMDDGIEVLGRSNESMYAPALKALIDGFLAAHADRIDPARVVIGGLSNGGFMTVRMCLDHPGFFAAGIPVCAPFFTENQTPEVVARLAETPLWFVHAKEDEIVEVTDTALPLYHALRATGAEAHFTLFDRVEDLTGVYREADGSPRQLFNHCVWVNVYHDFCRTDLDGSRVLMDGEPVGCWEWAARHRRK